MLIQLQIWLNNFANVVGSLLLAPLEFLPGWFSATVVAGVTGVVMLWAFKYTSNQTAIKHARDQINANLLAVSLFKDHLGVSLRCQGRLFQQALNLLWLSLRPMTVMMIPMLLVLGQLALWYQARPLKGGEDSIVTVQLDPKQSATLDQIELVPSSSVKIVAGPVRIPSKNQVAWNVTPVTDGNHQLQFQIGAETFSKEFVAGQEFHPISQKRPARQWSDVLIHPREMPFAADSKVQSIELIYPERESLTSGTNHWVIYWFAVSMVAAFAAKPILKVNI